MLKVHDVEMAFRLKAGHVQLRNGFRSAPGRCWKSLEGPADMHQGRKRGARTRHKEMPSKSFLANTA